MTHPQLQGGELYACFKEAALEWDRGRGALQRRMAEMDGGDQRSDTWFAMREDRLTASAYGNALGSFPLHPPPPLSSRVELHCHPAL